MQSSANNSLIDRGQRPNELEEGELEEDEDNKLWEQIEDLANTTGDSMKNDSSCSIDPHESSRPSISPIKRCDLQSDRLAGGFWAKLLKTKAGNPKDVHRQDADRKTSPILAVSRIKDRWLEVNADSTIDANGRASADVLFDFESRGNNLHSTSDSFLNHSSSRRERTLDARRGGNSFEIIDGTSKDRESSWARRFARSYKSGRTSSRNGSSSLFWPAKDSLSSTRGPSNDNNFDGPLKAGVPAISTIGSNSVNGDDEELIELELRLKALQSTMRNDETKTKSTSSGNEANRSGRSDLSKMHRRSRSRRLNGRSSLGDRSLEKYFDDQRKGDKPSQRDSKHHSSPQHHSPAFRDLSRQLQQQRERILNMPDPKLQYQAFLDMVTTPRTNLVGAVELQSIGSPIVDNLDASNMDISDDSEDETRPKAQLSLVGGFWRRPSPSQKLSPGSQSIAVPRELDNKAASSDSHQGQPSVSAAVGSDLDSLVSGTSPRNDQPIHSEPAVEIDDNDDEEMEALRELALKSMERPKTKQNHSLSSTVAHNGLAASLLSPPHGVPPEKQYVKNHASLRRPKNADLSSTDNEEMEIVITLDKELVKRRIEWSRQKVGDGEPSALDPGNTLVPTREIQFDRPKAANDFNQGFQKATKDSRVQTGRPEPIRSANSPASKPPIARVSSFATASSPYPSSGDIQDQKRRLARPLSKSNLHQIPNVIHKPLIIPLDSDSSDDDDRDQAGTTAVHLRGKGSIPSAVITDTRTVDEASRMGNQRTKGARKIGSSPPSNVSLITQLEGRLRVCVDDLTRHQSCLDEDRKRLRMLQSIITRKKTDLRLAEMKMQKLKQELRLTESQSATCRVNIAKFNTEVQKVQSRVDKNFDLHLAYLRQWNEINQLVAKHKIDILSKVPQAKKNLPKPRRLDLPKKILATARKTSFARKRASRDGDKATHVKRRRRSSSESSGAEPKSCTSSEDVCSNPLRWFRSYRLSPFFRTLDQLALGSPTFSNKLNPFVPLCPFELSGRCVDPQCLWQHEKDYRLTEVELIADLLSYEPAVVSEQADEKTTRIFSEELFSSLRTSLSLDEILAYCLSKVKAHGQDNGVDQFGIETKRKWIICQSSNRYGPGSTEWSPAKCDGSDSESIDEKPGRFRYFHSGVGEPPEAVDQCKTEVVEVDDVIR